MAPKRQPRREGGSGETSGITLVKGNSAKRQTRQATRAQIQAQEEADHYKEHVPLSIRMEVERVVEGLWVEAKAMPRENLHEVVAD